SFITVDSSGNITDLNPASEMLFEYPREELTGWPLERLMPQKFVEENGDRVFEKFVEMTTQVGIKTIELYARKKDGNEFPVEVSVSKWEIKGDIFYSVATRDITERKFFIKTLLNNEHRLFQFLDAVPIGIFVRDKSGMSYYANQTAKKIFGMDLIKNRIPIDKASQMYDFRVAGTNEAYPIEKLPVIRALKGEKSFVDDLELRHGNEITPLHSWGAPIFDEHDEIKYVLAAVMDVSRQKEITESLRSREEFFRNLFEEGPIGMTLAFPNSTLVNVNRAFCDMLGFTKDQLIGKSFLEFTHPEYIPAEQLLTQKLFDKMIPNYQVEERYMTKKGQSIWCKLSASVIRDLSGEPLFRLAVVENITDQKEAETALKESEEKFRRVFAESPLGMSFITKDGKIEEINKAFCEMLGYSSEELVNTSIYNITHP
ncbi:MAG TPA: PAS domain S-box protein, partial [bacterium]